MMELTEHLKIIPPTVTTRGKIAITFGATKTGAPYLSLSRSGWQALELPRFVAISISRSQVALEVVEESHPAARRVGRGTLRIPAADILALFSIKAGEKFVMPAEIEHGRLIAPLADTLVTRYLYKRRQQGRTS